MEVLFIDAAEEDGRSVGVREEDAEGCWSDGGRRRQRREGKEEGFKPPHVHIKDIGQVDNVLKPAAGQTPGKQRFSPSDHLMNASAIFANSQLTTHNH